MEWIDRGSIEPPTNRILLCYCPMWSDSGYQAATWNGKEFAYEEQSNDIFDSTVERWAIFLEAD